MLSLDDTNKVYYKVFYILIKVPCQVYFGVAVMQYNVPALLAGRVAIAADVSWSVASGEIRVRFNCGHNPLAGTLAVPAM